jgi:DNA-directed RNA polymerase subunit omega
MIEELKDDHIIDMVGGRFRLAAMIQKRWLELVQGSRPLVDDTGRTAIEVVIEEIRQGKVVVDEASEPVEPAPRA